MILTWGRCILSLAHAPPKTDEPTCDVVCDPKRCSVMLT